MLDAWLESLVHRFDGPEVRALVLMGSHAAGGAGPYSDVDLVRFIREGEAGGKSPKTRSLLIDGRLVVVSDVRPSEVEEWFTSPLAASNVVGGLRRAQPLLDRDGTFAAVRERAHSFVWDGPVRAEANAWASRQMVGWCEEARKGLEGLRRGDAGRLLNARHGLSWGLSQIMQVSRGVLLSGDNGFYEEVADAVGRDCEWTRLRATAFGVEGDGGRSPSLREQVVAGLRLYALTAELMADALRPEDEPLIVETVRLIGLVLDGSDAE